MTKIIETHIPDGYEIDREKSTFEKIVLKQKENDLPSSWDQLENIKGYYIDSMSELNFSYCGPTKHNLNTFATEEQAKASIALAQLSQLREIYRNGWKPDYLSLISKYSIVFHCDKPKIEDFMNFQYFLTFETKEIARKFLTNFYDLIQQAKPLL